MVQGRKAEEYAMIGDDIKVKITKVKKGGLRLAIHAPRNLPIVRGAIQDQQKLIGEVFCHKEINK